MWPNRDLKALLGRIMFCDLAVLVHVCLISVCKCMIWATHSNLIRWKYRFLIIYFYTRICVCVLKLKGSCHALPRAVYVAILGELVWPQALHRV